MPDRIPLTCLLLIIALPGLTAPQGGPPPRVVQVAEVARTEVTPTVAVPGTVFSRNEMRATAGIAGRLVSVAEPGTLVQTGRPIARIDTGPLALQRAEQEALLARAEINLRQLESELARQRELIGSNLVSEFELEQTTANRDLASSDAAIIRVRIRQIDDQIERAVVRAPFDGIVISRARRAGEDVARGEALAQLTDIANLEVRAFVPLKHLPRVAAGAPIDVFATDARHTGAIRALVPTGDVRSQTFEAMIDLPRDAAAAWTVGQLVSVAVPIKAGQLALTVPRDALVLRANGTFVFRINEQDRAERIAVQIGDSSGELVSIRGDLAEGDRVAIRGAENLDEGAQVRVLVSESAVAADQKSPDTA